MLDAGLLSDVGCVRTNNEDSGGIFRDEEEPGQGRILLVIADGMGGHNAGEVASALATDTLGKAFIAMREDPGPRLKQAVAEANRRIFIEAGDNPEHSGMGTTCTALLLQEGIAYSAHVGDSRIYLLRDGDLYLITEDDSHVMEMVRAGVLTMEEARHHPDKHILTRALGRQPEIEIATWPQGLTVQPADTFLVCSDGLCDVLDDDELNGVVSSRNANDACQELVRLARCRYAADNITAAIVRVLPAARQM